MLCLGGGGFLLGLGFRFLFGGGAITLEAETYLTDSEASERLKVSRQTLQDYRNEGKIPFCRIGGKILYRSSDLQRMLDDSYREAYR